MRYLCYRKNGVHSNNSISPHACDAFGWLKRCAQQRSSFFRFMQRLWCCRNVLHNKDLVSPGSCDIFRIANKRCTATIWSLQIHVTSLLLQKRCAQQLPSLSWIMWHLLSYGLQKTSVSFLTRLPYTSRPSKASSIYDAVPDWQSFCFRKERAILHGFETQIFSGEQLITVEDLEKSPKNSLLPSTYSCREDMAQQGWRHVTYVALNSFSRFAGACTRRFAASTRCWWSTQSFAEDMQRSARLDASLATIPLLKTTRTCRCSWRTSSFTSITRQQVSLPATVRSSHDVLGNQILSVMMRTWRIWLLKTTKKMTWIFKRMRNEIVKCQVHNDQWCFAPILPC